MRETREESLSEEIIRPLLSAFPHLAGTEFQTDHLNTETVKATMKSRINLCCAPNTVFSPQRSTRPLEEGKNLQSAKAREILGSCMHAIPQV